MNPHLLASAQRFAITGSNDARIQQSVQLFCGQHTVLKASGTQTGGSRLSVSFPSCLCGPFPSKNARPISPTGSPPRSDAPSPEPLIAAQLSATAQLSVTAYCRPLIVPPRWEASPPGSFLSLVLPTAYAHAWPAPERSEPPVDFTSPTKRQSCRVWRRKVSCSRSPSWEETELGFEPGPFSAALSTLLCRYLVTARLIDVRLVRGVTQISARASCERPGGWKRHGGQQRTWRSWARRPCPYARFSAAFGYGWTHGAHLF